MAATYIVDFPRELVEAHGLGMVRSLSLSFFFLFWQNEKYKMLTTRQHMKLADIAISVADMVSCMPRISAHHHRTRVGAVDVLKYLAGFIFSISNSVNPRLGLLQEKISGEAWSSPLEYPPWGDNGLTTSINKGKVMPAHEAVE